MNILDLAMEQQVNQQTAPIPTERAQLNLLFKSSQNIIRFNTAKKGEKAYVALCKAWDLCKVRGNGPMLHEIQGDMFDATVDLSELVSASYIDLAKRQKFIPWQG